MNDEEKEDCYEAITETEREIMSYLDNINIQMVKPEEISHKYFQQKRKFVMKPANKSSFL